MNIKHIRYLHCPACNIALHLSKGEPNEKQRIQEGFLGCPQCGAVYPIKNYIPRFVPSDASNYAKSFGYQWNKHFQSQYDRYSGAPISEERFLNETRWGRNLTGQLVLEAGSGSGRFTEHAVSTGAMVISFDYSHAVEANYRNNGQLDNLLIIQASIYEMPFLGSCFDKIFCIGVIQHTPFPQKAFVALARVLRSGGNLVIDAYRVQPGIKKYLESKYWVRPLTRRLPHELLYRFCDRWVNLWWGVTGLSRKITGRRSLSWFMLIADYRGVYPLPDNIQKEWAVLDSFDMLSPAYDFPQTLESLTTWYKEAGFTKIEVGYGYNDIEARGDKL
jgi:SAM-dependent methyltransferase